MNLPLPLQKFKNSLPNLIDITIDEPALKTGEWWLDLAYSNQTTQIVWTKKHGFGFFNEDDRVGFSSPNFYVKTTNEANSKLFQLFNLKTSGLNSQISTENAMTSLAM